VVHQGSDACAQDEIDDMLGCSAAVTRARGLSAPTVFEFWRDLYAAQSAWAKTGAAGKAVPALLAHFGTSLVERALIDAFGRARGVSFAAGLRENVLAWISARCGRSWRARRRGTGCRRSRRRRSSRGTPCGLGDALEDGDIGGGRSAWTTACRRRSMRVCAPTGSGVSRSRSTARRRATATEDQRMARILARECAGRDWAFSLDGNLRVSRKSACLPRARCAA